ncbi:hypothetical protein [Luteimonas sp. MC1750]|uniref:hypothetical protein n=1 Tax=Luteimonas sp. MC1750 TaxID=2799326 RepID=UPI0018F0A88C|nr:hypothetical protein [Luteimonas sp. MC1750]MBJ6984006.1 hypothetical protein [Luteimonas sp. MC1750]QQO06818.1 hypothetical protein JGR68_05170 [Luteimonas sp. MC1750]
MKNVLTLALACGLVMLSTNVEAQSKRARLLGVIYDTVEGKIRDQIEDERREEIVDPRVRPTLDGGVDIDFPDPIEVAKLAMLGDMDANPVMGAFYPPDPSFIPPELEGYTHVRRGGGSWQPFMFRGLGTCDPMYLANAHAKINVAFDDLPYSCKKVEAQIIGGVGKPNVSVVQVDGIGIKVPPGEVAAAYAQRVATLGATNKYYSRGAGTVLKIRDGVVISIPAKALADLPGKVVGPNALDGDYGLDAYSIYKNTLNFFIPLSPQEIETRAVRFNRDPNFHNHHLHTIFYRITGVRTCPKDRHQRYEINVEVDEVRYYMGRGLDAPYKTWRPGTGQSQPNGLPFDAMPSGPRQNLPCGL